MAAGKGQLIEVIDYSSIKSKIDNIFGTGSGQSGYGQQVTSPTVALGDIIRASHWNNLRTDLIKARQHQTGATIGTSNVSDGFNLLPITQNLTLISEEIRNQYNAFADIVVNNKFQVHSSQLSSLEVLAVKERTTGWSNTLNHTVTVTGSSANQAGSANNIRHFFNAGGKIVISSSRTAGTLSSKNNAWTGFLSSIGDVVFDYTSTTAGAGTASLLGWFDLTTSEQLIFSHSQTNTNKTYKIYAKRDINATQLILRIEFYDDSSEDPTLVNGTLRSQVNQYRPVGSNVEVLTPSATQSGLDETLPRIITYTPTFFTESAANDGSLIGTSTITVQNDAFNAGAGESIQNFSFTNLPAGLVPVLTRSSSFDNQAILSFTGNATSHGALNNVSNVQLNFGNSSFISGSSGTINYSINFLPPTYSVLGSPSSVTETGSVTFTVNTVDVLNGTTLYYTIEGTNGTVNASDFTSPISGSVTINNNVGLFNLNLSADSANEGPEKFVAKLRTTSVSGPIVATSNEISITDSSRSVAYTIIPRSTTVSEGGTVVFDISMTDAPIGTTLFWEIYSLTGNITASDFSGNILSGAVGNPTNSSAWTGTLSLTISADNLTEGYEDFRVRLRTGSSSGPEVAVSSDIRINDTSTGPTYKITPNVYNVNEGSSVTFTVDTTNVLNNTTLYWNLVGLNNFSYPIAQNMWGNNLLDNYAVWPGPVVDNSTVTLVYRVYIETQDTYSISSAIDNSGYLTIDGVRVLDNLSMNTKSTSVVLNSGYHEISITGTNETGPAGIAATLSKNNNIIWSTRNATGAVSSVLTSADVNTSAGNFKISNNKYTFTINVLNDYLTEGTESFKVTLSTTNGGSPVAETSAIVVNDTSGNPQEISISVIDEADPALPANATDWASFVDSYPNRNFILFQPREDIESLHLPASFFARPRTQYFSVTRDPIVTDWFETANLGQYPAGTKIVLSVDNSGSMNVDTVIESIRLFAQKCSQAGFSARLETLTQELWVRSHLKSFTNISFPGIVNTTGNVIISQTI